LTPTAAAELIAPSQADMENHLLQAGKRLCRALERRHESARQRLDALARHPALRRPFDLIHRREECLDDLSRRADVAIRANRDRASARLATLAARLEAISPLEVLARGYSVIQSMPDGRLLTDAAQVRSGDQIDCRLAKGTIRGTVSEVREE
jgi:exodeoxyribonuclease VII large subunit